MHTHFYIQEVTQVFINNLCLRQLDDANNIICVIHSKNLRPKNSILNISNLAKTAGIAPNTASAWLNILKQSYLITTLPAYHKNINKTLRKSPKVYFWDTKLLNIQTVEQLKNSNSFGNIFENFVISEIMKNNINEGTNMKLYYMKDANNYEIDLVYKIPNKDDKLNLVEIKSTKTFKESLVKNIKYFEKGLNNTKGLLVYRGNTMNWGKYSPVNYKDFVIGKRR